MNRSLTRPAIAQRGVRRTLARTALLAATALVALTPQPAPAAPLLPTSSIEPWPTPTPTQVAAPAAVVGAWYTGTVSDLGFVDPNGGSYDSAGGEGVMYRFSADGSWSYGWLLTSRLYACSMRVSVYRQGVLAVSDPAMGMLQLDTLSSTIHSEDDCSEDGNYDHELPADDETLLWQRTTDEYGDVLLLRGPDTSFSAFRPMGTD
jgi:hypothetical protein